MDASPIGKTRNWRWLLKATATGSLLTSVVAAILFEPDVPIVTGVLIAVGLLWMRRPSRGGVIYTGIVHILIGLIVLVFFQNIAELVYPASVLVFATTGARLVLTVTAVVAMVGTLALDAKGARGSRIAAWIALLSLVAFIAVGTAARIAYRSPAREPGDVSLKITPETEWSTREVRAPSGQISVFVENQDVHHGSFTIKGVVDLDIPAGTSGRASFTLDPGEYRYYSKLYPGEREMQGTLVVS